MYAQVAVLDPKEHNMRKFDDDCRKQTTGKPERMQSESRVQEARSIRTALPISSFDTRPSELLRPERST